MAYLKLRGARKAKKRKEEETKSLAEQDAFQEQGKKMVDRLMSHPYFILGTVALVLSIVFLGMFISSRVKANSDEKSASYAAAVEVFESETGESSEFKTETEKYDKAISLFNSIIEDQKGSTNAVSAMMYVGKAYYAKNQCDKAIESFKNVRTSGKLEENLLFGAYEGEAYCYFDKGDFEKAIGIWKEWLDKTTPLYKDNALYYIGVSLEKLGKKDEALTYFKRIRDEYPKSMIIGKIIDKIPAEKIELPKKQDVQG
ncbi:MAG TPA: tetratricopeptide repeat protein [bacterium]|nr:tetratricopeptide repeat protein [bacterium]HPS29828.1 tetratricopeptide repeat protein [bacterium]